MDRQRMGEIAHLYFMDKVRREGVRIGGENFEREAKKMAKAINMDFSELMDVIEDSVREIVDSLFSASSDHTRTPKTSRARKLEVAFLMFGHKMRREGFRIGGDSFKRDLGNKAKEIGITTEEAMEFAHHFVQMMVDETFAKKGTN